MKIKKDGLTVRLAKVNGVMCIPNEEVITLLETWIMRYGDVLDKKTMTWVIKQFREMTCNG